MILWKLPHKNGHIFQYCHNHTTIYYSIIPHKFLSNRLPESPVNSPANLSNT